MGHRSQPKVQLYLRKPGINAGALPIAISLEERQTAPYVWGIRTRSVQRRCSMNVVPSVLSRIAATKAILEQKFHLTVECIVQGLGNPRWRDDDLTSNVFGSDARVDTLARCVGITASRGSAR